MKRVQLYICKQGDQIKLEHMLGVIRSVVASLWTEWRWLRYFSISLIRFSPHSLDKSLDSILLNILWRGLYPVREKTLRFSFYFGQVGGTSCKGFARIVHFFVRIPVRPVCVLYVSHLIHTHKKNAAYLRVINNLMNIRPANLQAHLRGRGMWRWVKLDADFRFTQSVIYRWKRERNLLNAFQRRTGLSRSLSFSLFQGKKGRKHSEGKKVWESPREGGLRTPANVGGFLSRTLSKKSKVETRTAGRYQVLLLTRGVIQASGTPPPTRPTGHGHSKTRATRRPG